MGPFSAFVLNNRPNFLTISCTPSSTPPMKTNTTVSTKLDISGLSFRTTEESLRNAFQHFGQLVEVSLKVEFSLGNLDDG
ncbi:hypothetical protein QJS10_CPA01g00205 [Acorus calamus]|uniref:RRM domain-containing protein n=1 Tax=Acorus calamus TaxID=4465 RepID=A0AAV9FK51_ACOCL|nr:hypothetical protein QJS10_CPA01g00205 [Acorus calamus]